ncbi:uncharacterized protein LOC115890364 [Sitophilus oryzae]|uniref:Uncharacterized protein LOC115890364 n=1 Tax=Sitophilus oryzae TaxID=7048 RepID=A0A6J2YSZ6_SITOR|nr:uncharacterized protein LOC115890364 [Sitophilus oryzae]
MENTTHDICKIIILESKQKRLFHPRIHENFFNRISLHKKPTSSSTKRCLFGKANSDDTKKLLQEQYLQDQERFFKKFGFDIKTIEDLENCKDDVRENIENDRNTQNKKSETTACGLFDVPVKNLGRKILKARRKVTFSKAQTSQSQKFITDFYQSRKSSCILSDKNSQPQESSSTSSQSC